MLPATGASVICLLDDDLSFLKGLGRLLSWAGWRTQPFSDPAEFLRYAQTQPIAVAVIDLCMPLINGLEVQSRLREVSPSTRVIMVTAHGDGKVERSAIELGAIAFFKKPFNDTEFLSAIERAAGDPAQNEDQRTPD